MGQPPLLSVQPDLTSVLCIHRMCIHMQVHSSATPCTYLLILPRLCQVPTGNGKGWMRNMAQKGNEDAPHAYTAL